ncbi:MAG: hypothetical protein INR65_07400 [Gluconacetobacter diazotrophicus]|nr:hypothetical protein [Gluconacetobacter diazotrophicus]
MPRSAPLLAAILVLAVLGGLWSRTEPAPLGIYDQPFYLGIAFDLVHHGRFTDGYRFARSGPGGASGERPSSMRFTPLYPALLAAGAVLDPAMRADMDCLVSTGGGAGCGRHATPVRVLQFLLCCATGWLVWWQARLCTHRNRTAFLALGLFLLAAPTLLRSVDTLMTETATLFLCVAAEAAALRAWCAASGRGDRQGDRQGDRPGDRQGWVALGLVLSGILSALATLCRPGLEPVCLLAALLGAAASLRRRTAGSDRHRFARSAWLFGAGYAAALLPWLIRNALVCGRFSLTFGYASHTFVQRLSFDGMTPRELELAFVCWLPDGSGLGTLLSGSRTCDRFGWDDHPGSFYSIGLGPMLDSTLRAAGGWDHHATYLVRTFLLADPVRQIGWHLLVTLPLLLRGMAVNHWWGVILGAVCIGATARALVRRGEFDRRFLLVALPPLALLALNAGVAVNQPRYNLLLLLPFAVAGARLLDRPRSAASATASGTVLPAVAPPSGPPENVPAS